MLVRDDHVEVKNTVPFEEPKKEMQGVGEGTLDHLCCTICYPTGSSVVFALCGTEIDEGYEDDEDYFSNADNQCVVCTALEYTPCDGCGQ